MKITRMAMTHNTKLQAQITLNDPRWQYVLARDAQADGTFFYSVKTPGCIVGHRVAPSRRGQKTWLFMLAVPMRKLPGSGHASVASRSRQRWPSCMRIKWLWRAA